MEGKAPMQKQSFAYILGWSQEKIAGQSYCMHGSVLLLAAEAHLMICTIMKTS